jgi:hypothetical protein
MSVAILMGALVCGDIVRAQGVALFSYASSSQAAAKSPESKIQLQRIKSAQSSMEVVYINISPQALANESLAFPLPSGEVLSLKKKATIPAPSGQQYWNGATADGDEAFFAVTAGQLSGSVRYRGKIYTITPLLNNEHVLEYGVPAQTKDHSDSSGRSSIQKAPSRPLATAKAPSSATVATAASPAVVDLLVYYTAVVGSGTINRMVAEMNQSFSDSGIFVTVRLVGFERSNMATTGNDSRDLNSFISPAVLAKRDEKKADIVVLISPLTLPWCGLVLDIGPINDRAFAIVDPTCMVNQRTLSHEIGHLFGARHMNDPGGVYERGHLATPPNPNTAPPFSRPCFRTMMVSSGETWHCNYNGPDGTDKTYPDRINRWSNPELYLYGLYPTGTSEHNNARFINEWAPTVASFREASFGGSGGTGAARRRAAVAAVLDMMLVD